MHQGPVTVTETVNDVGRIETIIAYTDSAQDQ